MLDTDATGEKVYILCSSTIPTLRDALRQIVSGPYTLWSDAAERAERDSSGKYLRGNAKPKSTCSAQSRSAQRANK